MCDELWINCVFSKSKGTQWISSWFYNFKLKSVWFLLCTQWNVPVIILFNSQWFFSAYFGCLFNWLSYCSSMSFLLHHFKSLQPLTAVLDQCNQTHLFHVILNTSFLSDIVRFTNYHNSHSFSIAPCRLPLPSVLWDL